MAKLLARLTEGTENGKNNAAENYPGVPLSRGGQYCRDRSRAGHGEERDRL